MVNNFEEAFKNAPWNESDLESHILDLVKLTSALLSDTNRVIQISSLEILKEMVRRMGYHLAPYVGNLVEVLQEALASPNIKIKSKTERILHKFMKNVHPMTVIWELMDERDYYNRNETVLNFIISKLKSFSYYELDLVSLFATVGLDLEDQNPRIRAASCECVKLLLEIMDSSPVPGIKSRAICILIRNSNLQNETLRSIGIAYGESEESNDFESYSGDSTASTIQATAQTTNSFPSGQQLSSNYRMDFNIPKNKCSPVSGDSLLSFAKLQSDEEVLYDEGLLSQVCLNKPTSKSTPGDKQNNVCFFPINSRGMPCSEPSLFEEASSATFTADTTLDDCSFGVPRHSSTPRKGWTLTPEDQQTSTATISETAKLSSINELELLHRKAPLSTGKKKSYPKLKSRSQPNTQVHRQVDRIGDGEWRERNLTSQNSELYERQGEGDFVNVNENDVDSYTKSSQKNICQVEVLNPKKYNFNILQVSTPNTMELSMDDYNSKIVQEGITEVVPSSVTTPGYLETIAISSKNVKKTTSSTKNKKRTLSESSGLSPPDEMKSVTIKNNPTKSTNLGISNTVKAPVDPMISTKSDPEAPQRNPA
ncbi:TOG array regulator of axonemal microtubules protein 1 [Caerostris extrusa]|uniref:TOG array regulator of axonemal microtubules protein 1 n=1 Tax=Caerostris extrusa TaxID=172846 RepID=A0AAV4S929_CAEEX|nr:TOG array regulator of axonemal microtubules protein 1 [Caerostris extrusa]